MSAEVLAADPIVYSRCERTSESFELTGEVTINGVTQTLSRTMIGLDIYDHLPDVNKFFGGFAAPCDLIYRDAVGVETVIYDCSTNSSMAASCAALDPAVSFDGNTIAFSVFQGPLVENIRSIHSQVLHPDADPVNMGAYTLPNTTINPTGSHLHFYNLDTQTLSVIPFESGIFDSGPAFTSDERIAFTSTRDEHAATRIWGFNASSVGTRLWSMDINGKNLKLDSHHSLSQEQHPYPLKDGRLAYSSWQIFGSLPFRWHTSGKTTTVENLFHIYAQAPDGSGNFPIYGQHSGDHTISTFGEDHNAAHFITQTSDERIWFADYYRRNNKALGAVVGVMQEPIGQEGIDPMTASVRADMYVPNDVINGFPWSHNADHTAIPMGLPAVINPNYLDPLPFAGRVGHPGALPNNGLMVSWGQGGCSTVANNADIFARL
jgi:hypothetical protein